MAKDVADGQRPRLGEAARRGDSAGGRGGDSADGRGGSRAAPCPRRQHALRSRGAARLPASAAA
eukprot:5486941-Prymnesium_polylepis.1